MLQAPVHRLFLCLLATGISATALVFDDWQCGIEKTTRRYAFDVMQDDCPDSLDSVNTCCVEHDACYGAQLGREMCDDTFCACAQHALNGSSSLICHTYINAACWALMMLGNGAYEESAIVNANETPNHTHTVPYEEIIHHRTHGEREQQQQHCGLTAIDDGIAYRSFHASCAQFEDAIVHCCLTHGECLERNSAEACASAFCDCGTLAVDDGDEHCTKHLVAFCDTILPISLEEILLDLPLSNWTALSNFSEVIIHTDMPTTQNTEYISSVNASSTPTNETEKSPWRDMWSIAVYLAISLPIVLLIIIACTAYHCQSNAGYYTVYNDA